MGFLFDSARKELADGTIDLDTNTIKLMLVTSAYTPNRATHTKRSDVTNEVSGTGYTTGGVTVSGVGLTITQANSWTAWAASTAYKVGDIRRPPTGNGSVYMCIVAGTSHSAEPSWPTTRGKSVAEGGGTCEWVNVGSSVMVVTCTNPVISNATITARAGVLYKSTGVAANDNLIGYSDFGSDITSTNAAFTITMPIEGLAASVGMT